MLNYRIFPATGIVNSNFQNVIDCFEAEYDKIDSEKNFLNSNAVLKIIAPRLENLKFSVEKGKAAEEKIKIPVLFDKNNNVLKTFDVDAVSKDEKTVIEVEAGRAIVNNQILKDLFEVCVMPKVEYLILAVRNIYRNQKDFQEACSFFETLYFSERLKLPLKEILLIGY